MDDGSPWTVLTTCDSAFAADLRAVLDDGVIESRTAAPPAEGKFDQPIAGVRTSFGARSSTVAIEVRHDDLARAHVLLAQHQLELERAMNGQASSASPEQLADDARWIAARKRRQERFIAAGWWMIGGLVLIGLLAALYGLYIS